MVQLKNLIVAMEKSSCVKIIEKTAAKWGLEVDSPWFVLLVGRDSPANRQMQSYLSELHPIGRHVRVIAAHSATDVFSALIGQQDIAVILIEDGFGETEDACFTLIKEIREMGIGETRIIVYSTAANTAAENVPADDYDIDDFRGSKHISRRTVETMVASAIRAYRQLNSINRSHRMLRRIAQTSAVMIDQGSVAECALVATHAAVSLLSAKNGFLCFKEPADNRAIQHQHYGVGCFGAGSRTPSGGELELIERAFLRESHVFETAGIVFFIKLHDGPNAAAIFVDAAVPHDEVTHRLVDILSVQIASAINKMWFVHRIEYLALHDEATGLPNRRAIEREIDWRLARGESNCFVSIVSVETHSEVEASLGEDTASRMVKSIADRFIASGLKVGRISPSQLVILGEAQGDSLTSVPRALNQPTYVDGLHLPVHLTIGMYELKDLDSGSVALRRARVALREARAQNRGQIRSYDAAMTDAAAGRLSMISDLKRAIDASGQFAVHYQPQYDISTGYIIGAEALLRWKRNGVNVSPADFIPLAEATGLIREIGLFPIIEGINQAARWYRQGYPVIVGINLSPTQLGDTDVIEAIKLTLKETGVPAGLIEFELTETAATTQNKASSIINLLSGLGFRIAIDDFGTGYSSLERLANLKFDRIKIDREFVSKAPFSATHHAVCQLAVNLANSLGISVLAEGVETEEQAQLLRNIGCREAQGFLYGRPVPAQQIIFPMTNTLVA